MKKVIFVVTLFLFSVVSHSQDNSFNKALKSISSDIATKLHAKGKEKVVVLYITDINKQHTNTGAYLADIVSVNIVNDPKGFLVFDRDNLQSILDANKLSADGYVDVKKAQELGKQLLVEAIILGKYTVMENFIQLTLKALDADTGFVVAASMKDLPIDEQASIPGIRGFSNQNGRNRGYNNTPLMSNEERNNPDTTEKNCAIKKTGVYCFENQTKHKVRVRGDAGLISTFYLSPGQTSCYYNISAGKHRYQINTWNNGKRGQTIDMGEFYVEQCESKTYTIK